MLPLHDHNPGRSVPWATWGICGLCAVVFLLQWYGSVGAGWEFVPNRAMEPDRLTRWVTHQFLHGSWFHIWGNLWYLGIYGNNVEDRLGPTRFIIFYLLCGIIAAAAQLLVDPGSRVPMVGASGAIAGVMGAYLVLFPQVRVEMFVGLRLVTLPAWVALAGWFVWQFFLSLPTEISGRQLGGGVAYQAHAGGFVAGLILVRLFDRGRTGN